MSTTQRRKSTQQVGQIDRDAKEFGVGVRCGGWRLGLLVARSVEKGTAGRPKAEANHSLENDSPAKVSMNQFAELAGVSVSHVKYYYDAWELAAKANLVPSADSIKPGEDDVDVEADSIEVDENPRTHWSHFYQQAKNPQAKAEKPEKKEKKEDSTDHEVDEDFGLSDDDGENDSSMTESERAEADSNIFRNELLEVLESLRAVESRLTRIGVVSDDKDGLLSQIASVAMDISTMSMAVTAVNEAVEV